jgi:hypothetical protein
MTALMRDREALPIWMVAGIHADDDAGIVTSQYACQFAFEGGVFDGGPEVRGDLVDLYGRADHVTFG